MSIVKVVCLLFEDGLQSYVSKWTQDHDIKSKTKPKRKQVDSDSEHLETYIVDDDDFGGAQEDFL